MKTAAILAVSAIALASCTTTQTAKVDAQIQRNLPVACSALDTAYTGFTAIAASGKIRATTVAKVDAVYLGTRGICAAPEKATVADALLKAAQAYVVISAAIKEAKNVER